MTLTIRDEIPIASEPVSLAAGPHVFGIRVHAIRANADGTFRARLQGDAADAWRTYTVTAGTYTPGRFVAVTHDGTTLTAATDLLGVQLSEA